MKDNLYIALQSNKGIFKLNNSPSCEREIQDEIIRISELLNLNNKLNLIAGSLSHGDISVIEIAIALCLKPNFLLLDEPICGMGPSETEQTIKIIRNLSKTVDILIIEHDMDAVFSLAQDIVVMSQGSVIASGTPEQISKDRNFNLNLFGRGGRIAIANSGNYAKNLNAYYGKIHILQGVNLEAVKIQILLV